MTRILKGSILGASAVLSILPPEVSSEQTQAREQYVYVCGSRPIQKEAS